MTTPALTVIQQKARIGLVADSHCGADRPLPTAVFDVFRDATLILHLGDSGAISALDSLDEVAPVVATRGQDDAADDPRFAPVRVIEAGGVRIGAFFDLAPTGIALDERGAAMPVREALKATFGAAVDVVAFAATHEPRVAVRDGVLFVNPGSATLPAKPRAGVVGNVALLDVNNGVATVEIIDL